MMKYISLCSGKELWVPLTLLSGQCFNWVATSKTEWTGVLGEHVIRMKQTSNYDNAKFIWLNQPSSSDKLSIKSNKNKVEKVMSDYFQLHINLCGLYDKWSDCDPRISKVCTALPGMRILRQDPFECVISFICSSNNNIVRITKMIQALRKTYGKLLYTEKEGIEYHQFPSLEKMLTVSESDLRSLGFGYRAKYIVKSCELIASKGGCDWLHGLRSESDPNTVQENLMELHGVGRKVADCIALFSLDQTNSIPVDTHVWQISCRDYDTSLKAAKSLTPKVYKSVGELFRSRFGSYSGWAHSVLFASELEPWKSMLPIQLQNEMNKFATEEKNIKKMKSIEKKRKRDREMGKI